MSLGTWINVLNHLNYKSCAIKYEFHLLSQLPFKLNILLNWVWEIQIFGDLEERWRNYQVSNNDITCEMRVD